MQHQSTQRSRGEISHHFYTLTGGISGVRTNVELQNTLLLEVQLDIRDNTQKTNDLLTALLEQGKRKEKPTAVKICNDCGGTGEVTEYNDVMLADDAPKILPFKVPCPRCSVTSSKEI